MRAFAKAALLATLFCSAVSAIRPAQAQMTVVCPTCSNLFTQAAELAKEGQTYEVQAQAYANQLQQYALLVHNTAVIPTQVWNDAQNDIAQLHVLMNAGNMLAGNAGGITGRLSSLSSYAGQIGSLGNMTNQYQQWATTSGQTLRQLQTALGMQADTQANDAAIVAQMEAKASSATGQMQAIQAGAMFGASTTSQLMKLNQLTAAQMQLQGTQMGLAADRQGAQDAAVGAFLVKSDMATSGNPRY